MGSRAPHIIGALLVLAIVVSLGGAGMMAANTDDESVRDRAIASSNPDCSENQSHPDFGVTTWYIADKDGGFNLSINETHVDQGEPIRIRLENVGMFEQSTDAKSKYVLQKPHAVGWETIIAFRDPQTGGNETTVRHEPDSGFEWTFRANASGFSTGRYVVCEALSPGVYRFVYVGSDPPLEVRFKIRE